MTSVPPAEAPPAPWDLGGVLASDPGVYKDEIFSLIGEDLITYLGNSDGTPIVISNVSQIQSMNLGIWYKKDKVG